jgi:hypothetical protein
VYENVQEIHDYSRLSVAVLPTGQSLNAANPDPDKHPYYDVDQVVYVLYKRDERRTRATRVLTSFSPIEGWQIGTVLSLRHDQTGAVLGSYKIVGVKEFATGEEAGDVPDIAIKHAVLK